MEEGLPSSLRGLPSIPLPLPRRVLRCRIPKRFTASTAFAHRRPGSAPSGPPLREGGAYEAAGFRHHAYGLLGRSPPQAALSRRLVAGISSARRPPATGLVGLYPDRTFTGGSRRAALGTLSGELPATSDARFRAAFRSRSITIPHASHRKTRLLSAMPSCIWPHAEQVLVEGYKRGATTSRDPVPWGLVL